MAVLTMQQKYEEAQQAYHDLMTGRSVRVVVDQNGERVEYTAANSGKLSQYIEMLKRTLDASKIIPPMKVFL